ncbi:MAG TPA: cation-transporting P-type ATPase, partial [Pirellulales bacterium]|nr:cation-transporting P-type ATPase [Pirellulales bacterium]
MAIRPTAVLPKGLATALRRQQPAIRVSPLLTELASSAAPAVLEKLGTSLDGLNEAEAEQRLEQYGYNVVAEAEHHSRLRLLAKAIVNPLVILLAALAIISVLTGDAGSAVVMLVMILLGVGLRFWQEAKADDAAAALKAMISVTATVIRDGAPREVPLAQVVPGDVVKLAAGDMIPADLRL